MYVTGVVEAADGCALHRVPARLRARRGVPARVRGDGARTKRRGRSSRPTYLDLDQPRRIREGHQRSGANDEHDRCDDRRDLRVAMAEAFRGDGEILCNPIGAVPIIGGRLARATFEPDLMMTDTVAALVANTIPVGVPPARQGDRDVIAVPLDLRHRVDRASRHVVMGASQIDCGATRTSPPSVTGASPRRSCSVCAARPATPSTTPMSYWIPNHSKQVFVDKVDVVSAPGYDRIRALAAHGHRVASRSAASSPTSGCSISAPRQPHASRVACIRVSPSIRSSRDHVRIGDRRDDPRDATADCRRAAHHPRGHRPQGAPARQSSNERSNERASTVDPRLQTRATKLFGVPLSHRADGHGVGGQRQAHRGDVDRRWSRHPRVGADDVRPDGAGDRRDQGGHRQALRRQPAHRRARHRRAGRPHHQGQGAGGVVRAGARREGRQEAQGRRHRGDADHRRAPPRREGRGVGRRRGHRAGRRRAAATRASCPRRSSSRRCSTRSTSPCIAAGGIFDGRGLAMALAVGADGRGDGDAVLADQGQLRSPTRQGRLPRDAASPARWSRRRSTARRSASSAPT